MRSADELSQRRLLSGSRLAVLPLGSFEVHNQDLPLGTDAVIAGAVAQLVCERAQVLLMPSVPYTYAGVTAELPGTVSVDLSAVTTYLAALLAALLRAGLGPLVVVSAHGGNDVACQAAMEQVFHQRSAGLLYCNVLGAAYTDLMAQVWNGPDPALAENLCLWAAWDILGRSPLVIPPPPADQEGKPRMLRRIARAGHVAHTYKRPDQHIVIRDDGTVRQGHRFLSLAADRIVSALDDLKEYHNELTPG